ncbi:MAG TPA: hypothetical protein DEG88_16065 [Propionibacteriaceae bacterium]|nr:hypothetical protein [Propionibacteriaceae bacterium]
MTVREQGETLMCRRCGQPVVAASDLYDLFAQMHYSCFHNLFEHLGDPDIECGADSCPASGVTRASLTIRLGGTHLAQGASTFAPAVLALRELGFSVERVGRRFVARLGEAEFVADDPVALLGLIKLAELRTPLSLSPSVRVALQDEFWSRA